MKIIKIKSVLSMLLAGMALVACNSGGGGTSDVQSDSGTTEMGSSVMTYSFTATGCTTIVSGGSCNVALTYSTINTNGTASIFAGPLSFTTENIATGTTTTGFTSPDISLCPPVSTGTNTCNFSIQATGSANVNLAQFANLNSGATPYWFAAFQIGH